MIYLIDDISNIKINKKSLTQFFGFEPNLFNSMNLARRQRLVFETLSALSFDNKLPASGTFIKKWDFNAYISEKEGFAIDKNDLTASYSYSLANIKFANYKVLDTILHEFYHRYTTYHKDRQTDKFKLNLDGYFNAGDLIYYTQPTEIGARQFSIRMMEKINEYFHDKELANFIEYQKIKFKEENKNEYKGIRKEGYRNVDALYEFKARENVIDKSNLQKYVKITENNLNFYLDSYQDIFSIAIEEYNLNTEESLFLCGTCKDNTLYINNFYGPEAEFGDYIKKLNYLEEKLEQVAKYYENKIGKKITNLEISPFLQGLNKHARNNVISKFISNKDTITKTSFLDNQNFNIDINKENEILEIKIINNNDDIKFSSILNRLEDSKIDEKSLFYLKAKLNKYGLGDISNEETRKIFKYFVFKNDNIDARLSMEKLKESVENYFILKESGRLDDEIAENIITDEKTFDKFINENIDRYIR